MITSKIIRPKFHVYAEFIFAIVILLVICRVIAFYYSTGYLPPPFFDQAGDTFMDWYNTMYWGYRNGTYDEWFSVYPPFSFVFMKLFSTPSCYDESSLIGRECDPLGAWVITGFTALNAVLVYLDYRKADNRTAWPRAVAMGLGMPALFAWERGNVIVCCFTFFILAHGRLLRSTWLRWICFGFTVNLKPYLVLAVVGRLARRKWLWAEGCAVACVLIYAVSFMILGRGSPFDLIFDTLIFSGTPNRISLDYAEYGTSYYSMLDMLKTQLPLMYYIGSKPIEMVELLVPWAIKLAGCGMLVCLAGAVLRPTALSARRIAALTLGMLLVTSKNVGGYAELFLVFLVFFEKWERVGQGVALVATYALCVPWDWILVRIIHAETPSYLSGREVSFDFGLTLGALARPGLLLVVEYGLVAASLMDLSGFPWRKPERPASASPDRLEPGVGVAAS